MAVDRAGIVDRNFVDRLRELAARPDAETRAPPTSFDGPVRPGSALSARGAIELFESMLASRHLDFAGRALKARGRGYYTIGSSGHEGNAAVAAALRPSDPAFLHYRSGAFFVQRARQVPGTTPLRDVLLGMAAARDEPIAGGRHKVYGSLALSIPPQTSTIASHLPKAMGAAFGIDRLRRITGTTADDAPADRIAVCTFGDASANHSTATGAVNAACWAAHQNLPLPLLFVCEDNGLGISVHTPDGWVRSAYGSRPGLQYYPTNGLDPIATYDTARAAVEYVRRTRRPAFLHLSLVRLLGHAGSDVEQLYHDLDRIQSAEARDPVLRTAERLIELGWLTPAQVLDLYEEHRERALALAGEAERHEGLRSAVDVISPLAPRDEEAIRQEAARPVPAERRSRFWADRLPEDDRPRHLAMQLGRALGDLLVKYPTGLVFGEDVAKKGGVYHVTAGLSERAGVGRVFNTLLDETSILGVAQGAAQMGALAFPEIQYLAYLHNAIDQLRGEAASLSFFSQGAFRNPMVVRIASYAYQRGFGGHFHNDNSIAALRDIPGLVIASPSRAEDAVPMLRTCAAAAALHGQVSAFLEPIALYMTKHLHEEGDGLWNWAYDADPPHVPIGSGRTYGDGEDLTLVSFANGLWMSLRVARRLEVEHGIRCRVLDLRWLLPLPTDDLLREARATGRVLVVDETRRTGGVSEGVYTALLDGGYDGRLARVTGEDTFIPLGPAANLVLVQEADIERAALALVAGGAR